MECIQKYIENACEKCEHRLYENDAISWNQYFECVFGSEMFYCSFLTKKLNKIYTRLKNNVDNSQKIYQYLVEILKRIIFLLNSSFLLIVLDVCEWERILMVDKFMTRGSSHSIITFLILLQLFSVLFLKPMTLVRSDCWIF